MSGNREAIRRVRRPRMAAGTRFAGDGGSGCGQNFTGIPARRIRGGSFNFRKRSKDSRNSMGHERRPIAREG